LRFGRFWAGIRFIARNFNNIGGTGAGFDSHRPLYGPAHTDSDISVHFTDAEIFHVGDKFWNGYYPFIDYSTSGSIDGLIRATVANLAKVTDKTTNPTAAGR